LIKSQNDIGIFKQSTQMYVGR